MKRFSTTAGIIALVFFISILMGATSHVLAQGRLGGHYGKGCWTNLTDQQREAVREKRQQMREQGATREEIHTAVGEMLQGYGIQLPENWYEGRGGAHRHFLSSLTDEQREAVRDRIEQMRDQNATREEIHAVGAEMLKDYGIELPENWHERRGGAHRRFLSNLTDEQREAVRVKIERMRDQGAAREEIHAALAEMLKGYGVEAPEDGHGPLGFGHKRFGLGADLTEEQQEAVHGKIKELRGQGATWEQIHTEVAGMLKSFGIEVPENWRGPLGLRHKRSGLGANLSDEQREALRERIKQVRHQGASREGIHAAIAQMVKGFGAEQPENLESTSGKTETAQSPVTARNYPNPFNPAADIAYTLSVSENVRIQIYNVSGQLIRTFDMGRQPAGSYSVRWDGRNESGDMTASGVYLYRVEAGPHQVTNRMVLLK
jgi:hypothetical protein